MDNMNSQAKKRTLTKPKRPPFSLLLRLTRFDLEDLDSLIELTDSARDQRRGQLEDLARTHWEPEWLIDDYATLDRLPPLAAEFAIVGLWRCVEMYRKRALARCDDAGTAKSGFRASPVLKALKRIGIDESRLRCAKSVNELRCLNNSIKHEVKVGSELASFPAWREGEKLGDLTRHYLRLRPRAEKYLEDLSRRLGVAWKRGRIPRDPKQAGVATQST